MYQLAPSILSFDPLRLSEALQELKSAEVDWIHLDIMDGQFVPPITFGADLAASIFREVGMRMEAHLMTLTPQAHFDAFIKAGCSRVIFHAEVAPHAHRLCQELKSRGVEAGVAINPSTPVQALEPLLDIIDLALVMTVNPGWGGQKLISECLSKVTWLRERRPELEIEIDGGVNAETIRAGVAAGANVFVAGNYLTSQPISQAIENLRAAWA